MEQRLISFRKFKAYCNHKYDGYHYEKRILFCFADNQRCAAKNCPVWAKLKKPRGYY